MEDEKRRRDAQRQAQKKPSKPDGDRFDLIEPYGGWDEGLNRSLKVRIGENKNRNKNQMNEAYQLSEKILSEGSAKILEMKSIIFEHFLEIWTPESRFSQKVRFFNIFEDLDIRIEI